MLGFDDSKGEGAGFINEATTASRWSWVRASRNEKYCWAGSLLVTGMVGFGILVSPRGPAAQVTLVQAPCATAAWAQCGGKDFRGSSCCPGSHSCVMRSVDFSQCVPECENEAWDQCGGGKDFKGQSRSKGKSFGKGNGPGKSAGGAWNCGVPGTTSTFARPSAELPTKHVEAEAAKKDAAVAGVKADARDANV